MSMIMISAVSFGPSSSELMSDVGTVLERWRIHKKTDHHRCDIHSKPAFYFEG
jgi:hypothetical protein